MEKTENNPSNIIVKMKFGDFPLTKEFINGKVMYEK